MTTREIVAAVALLFVLAVACAALAKLFGQVAEWLDRLMGRKDR